MGYWNCSVFVFYDCLSGIGWCVNYDGVFVVVFMCEVDNYFVMVEFIDFVEYIKWWEGLCVFFDMFSL